MIGAIQASLRARILGPIAQVLGRPKYQVLTEQGFGLMLLGPTPLTWAAQDKWRHHQCGPAYVAQFCSLGIISKTVPISETASFSQNENVSFSKTDIKLFFQNKVISKITF